jgi:5-carboxymethyl-2-hydroxymuconate isomerase
MSDLGHSVENRNRVIELIDAIMAARSPAKVRELGEELVAVVAADRAADEAEQARAGSPS